MCGTFSDLLKISLSSCSDTNWPRLATKRVEQGALLTAMFGWDEGEPTGDASAGEGRKWGSDACIDVSVVGCGRDMGACKTETETTIFHHYPLLPSASIPRQFLFYFVRYLELMTTFSFVCLFQFFFNKGVQYLGEEFLYCGVDSIFAFFFKKEDFFLYLVTF